MQLDLSQYALHLQHQAFALRGPQKTPEVYTATCEPLLQIP